VLHLVGFYITLPDRLVSTLQGWGVCSPGIWPSVTRWLFPDVWRQSTGLPSHGRNVPEELFSETSNYSLDYQIKGDKVETASYTPVSEEKSTQYLLRKPKGKTIIGEDAVSMLRNLFSFHQTKIRTVHSSALKLWSDT